MEVEKAICQSGSWARDILNFTHELKQPNVSLKLPKLKWPSRAVLAHSLALTMLPPTTALLRPLCGNGLSGAGGATFLAIRHSFKILVS